MATIDDVIAGITAFRDETYSRLDAQNAGIIAFRDEVYSRLDAQDTNIAAGKSISRVCTTCGGDGYLEVYDSSPANPGGSTTQVPCPLCGGAEKIDWGFQEAL